MRLGMDMLTHPPHSSITVCACVCLQIEGKGCARQWQTEQEVHDKLDTITLHSYRQTFTHTCIRLHTCTNRFTNTLGPIYMKGNVTEPECIIHISISNPCETVDYACKFCCLQTDGFCCVFFFYLLQLNVSHYFVYSSFQRNICGVLALFFSIQNRTL